MPNTANLLSIPFKKTYDVNIKESARKYLQEHTDVSPDAFKADITGWHNLRRDATAGIVRVDQAQILLRYQAQLSSVVTKLSSDIGLEIPYAPVFDPDAVPISLKNLVFERVSIVFNLAALYSQLATLEDRTHLEGIKRAISFYQQAAGTLSYLRTTVLNDFILPTDAEEIPLDLTQPFVYMLEWLMLAQAQECFWQKAKLDNYKNILIAKLAANAASLYNLSSSSIEDSDTPALDVVPAYWTAHLQAKRHHFEAVAQYRKSIDELEKNRYGEEIARLSIAQAEAQKAYNAARTKNVSTTVLHDAKSLLDAVKSNYARAERDNDLIYHKDVPVTAALDPIPHAAIAEVKIPPSLIKPSTLVKEHEVFFGEAESWGAREAIKMYKSRKADLIETKINGTVAELKAQADSALRSINLPSSLEALERPVGLPTSILKKAEEVRQERGPEKIERLLEDLTHLAEHDTQILDEAMDILDSEASEDESARKDMSLDRPASYQANLDFAEKERKYREILKQALQSDETVRAKWDDWQDNIEELTWDETVLESSIPSSLPSHTKPTPQAAETQKHARALRVLLESLDGLHRDLDHCTRRVQALAYADDIKPRIQKAAAGFERLTKVTAVMFEDVLDHELAKYDKFIQEIEEDRAKQTDILETIKTRNEAFLQSRRDDPSIKDRERALQSLDLTYHKYREISANLEEGIKFYNDLAAIFTEFKERCRSWSTQRSQEISSLSDTFTKMSVNTQPAAPAVKQARKTAPRQRPQEEEHSETPKKATLNFPPPRPPGSSSSKSGFGLPPPSLGAGDWGFEAMQLPPAPQTPRRT